MSTTLTNPDCFDFLGRPPGSLVFAPCVASDAPAPTSCTCGTPATDLRVHGNVGTVTYVNGEITLLGRGGVFNTALGPNLMDNADYRNYTPWVVGPAGPSLVDDDPSEYSSIQAAIDAAVTAGATPFTKQFVFIKPGTYTENLTLSSAVDLYADSGSVIILGSHTWNPQPNEQIFLTRITLQQVPGSNLISITTGGFAPPPNIRRSAIVFVTGSIVQTDPATDAIVVTVPGGADVLTVAMIDSNMRGTSTAGAGRTLVSSGAGAIDFVVQAGGFNSAGIRISSLASATGTFLFSGNSIKVSAANVAESHFECTAPNTTSAFRACHITNDSTVPVAIGNGFLNVSAGVWMLLGNSIQNTVSMVIDNNGLGSATECWAIGNAISDNEGLPLFVLNNGALLYAQGNIISHTGLVWIDTTAGGGTYFQQVQNVLGVPQGTNTFRTGSTAVGGGITVSPATTF